MMLNMKALNSLIWASAILAKLGIVGLVLAEIRWIGLILVTAFEEWKADEHQNKRD